MSSDGTIDDGTGNVRSIYVFQCERVIIAADINEDGVLSQEELLDFVTVWTEGDQGFIDMVTHNFTAAVTEPNDELMRMITAIFGYKYDAEHVATEVSFWQ